MSIERALVGTTDAGGAAEYVEDVFSTYLYTGNGGTQTITNGVDLTKGGLVWIKSRTNSPSTDPNHYLMSSGDSFSKTLFSNSSNASIAYTPIQSVSSTGYVDRGGWPGGDKVVSWTFRKAPKFFDVVTYTGDGTSNRSIPHNLGSVPGCIIIKQTTNTSQWWVYHRSASQNLFLESSSTGAGGLFYISGSSTSANIVLGSNSSSNVSGQTFVAYLFAHDAGGFGASGTDSIISCGSFTGNTTVNLGWEPQYVLLKITDTSSDWYVIDNMRGWSNTGYKYLSPNTYGFEGDVTSPYIIPTATGFKTDSAFSGNWIYMAIRRPMKTPTSGTSVFMPYNCDSSGATSGFPIDLLILSQKSSTDKYYWQDRLRVPKYLNSNTTGAESSNDFNFTQTGFNYGGLSGYVAEMFRRAPGFFDVVCYTGTGVARTVNHNLGVAPELMIVKMRSYFLDWVVYAGSQGNTKYLKLNLTNASTSSSGSTFWNNTSPTSSAFTVGTNAAVNAASDTYVAYLFASCPGVSKVGSYTGNGSSQTINCGFAAGARFVLIKRTDNTGDWYVWDTARGIVSANDPHLSLNTNAAEVTTDDSIDPDSTGFIVNQVAATNINVSSGTYIYLAIS